MQGLSENIKQILLNYVISDYGSSGYSAIKLFPFEDGIYRSIDHNVAFIHRDKSEHSIFGLKRHKIDLSKLSCNSLQLEPDDYKDSYLYGSLQHLSDYDFGTYCLRTYFRHIDAVGLRC